MPRYLLTTFRVVRQEVHGMYEAANPTHALRLFLEDISNGRDTVLTISDIDTEPSKEYRVEELPS